jgi:hypothetical protein
MTKNDLPYLAILANYYSCVFANFQIKSEGGIGIVLTAVSTLATAKAVPACGVKASVIFLLLFLNRAKLCILHTEVKSQS